MGNQHCFSMTFAFYHLCTLSADCFLLMYCIWALVPNSSTVGGQTGWSPVWLRQLSRLCTACTRPWSSDRAIGLSPLPIKCKSQSLATKWPLQSLHLTPEKPLLVLGICTAHMQYCNIHDSFNVFHPITRHHVNEGIYFCYFVNLIFPLLIYILIFQTDY